MNIKHIITAVGAASLAFPAMGFAQDTAIELISNIQLVEASDEGEALIEAGKVVPGDTLEFSTSYRNHTGEIVSNFTLVNPVPAHVVVSANSADELEVSVDGGETWGALSALTLTDEDGASRPAAATDVTHMRWVIAELAPDASGAVRYRATVK